MLNKRLLKESSVKKAYLTVVSISSVLNSLFIVASAYFLATIVSTVFLNHKDLTSLKLYVLLFLLTALLKAVINFLMEIYIRNAAEDIKENIKGKSFNFIISGNPYNIKKEKIGELITLLTDSMETITPYYSQYIPQFISSLAIPLIILISVFSMDRLSALIMLITYPLIPIFMMLIGYKSKQLSEEQFEKLSILSSHFMDMLQGLQTLKIFGRSKIQEEKVFQISEDYRKATMKVLKTTFLSSFILELSSTISTAVIAVNLGLRLVYSKIDFFNAFFILVLTPDFYLPIRQLGLRFHASLNGKVAIEKIDSIMEAVSFDKSFHELVDFEEASFEIEVKKLNYTYEDREALCNVSFKINKGEKIALIGESGSGKSTLINILSGFIKPEDGTVFINGKDINFINKEDYLQKISVVPQFSHVFNKSIRENISLGIKSADEEEIKKVYEASKLEDLLNKVAKGNKTIIGEEMFSRNFPAQKVESKIGCLVLNKMTEIGMPISEKIKRAS